MGKPVNLNKVRKARAREDRQRAADANAVRFGRTKVERAQDREPTERQARHLDGVKREE